MKAMTTKMKSHDCFPRVLFLVLCVLVLGMTAVSARAQDQDTQEQLASRLFQAQVSAAGAAEVSDANPTDARAKLQRIISVEFEGVTLEEALRRIAEVGGVKLFYPKLAVLSERNVHLDLEGVTVLAAVRAVIRGTELHLQVSRSGHLVLFYTPEKKARLARPELLGSLHKLVPKKLVAFTLQTGTIAGTVTDSTTGEPIPGVNVVIAGTQRGAATDAEGRFMIPNLDPGPYDLVASFVGYNEKRVEGVGVIADDTTHVQIALSQTRLGLEEVVVVGYGTQREEYVTSAVASIDADEFITAAPRDAASLIKGKVAGLVVTSPSGNPTAGTEIRLRGTTTLMASSDPLVLIDGIPGDLNTVAPEMIASIDVLKGGSAAAIYGSRGSNGVILITTKEHTGDGPTIRYDGYATYETIADQPNFLDTGDYRRLIDEGHNFTDYGYSTDWQDQVLRNPISHTQNLSFSGGNFGTNYLASLNYQYERGIFLRSDNEVMTGRMNVEHSMFDGNVQANLNVIGRIQSHWNGWTDNTWRQAMIRNPTDRIRNEEGDWQERPISSYYNPLGLIYESNGEDKIRELRLNGTLTWSPTEYLNLRIMGSRTKETGISGYAETFQHISTTVSGLNGYASRESFSNSNQLMEFTGTYQGSTGDHVFELLGGYSYQRVVHEGFLASNEQFPTDLFGYSSLESGNALTRGRAEMSSYKSSYKVIGFFGRLNYNWKGRYLLMASLRYEGNSKFGADHKWGLFPAVSAGWRISEERFMKGVSFINELKIRAGFGVTGIAPSEPYQSLASYAYGDRFYYQGEWVQGIEPARNPNPDLHWERKKEINLGLDFALFDQRLSGSVDVYQRTTEDMLWNYDVPVPPYLYPSILANVGVMRNRGLEVALDYGVIRGEELRWKTGVNYATNSNELVSLSNELYKTTNDFFYTGYAGDPVQMPTHRVEVGKPIGNFYGWKTVDIDENGEWIILDKEGNRVPIAEATFDNRRYLGNGIPDHYLAWNNTFVYKNFDLSINMRGAFGFQILNFTRMHHENPTLVRENMLDSSFDPVYGKQLLSYPLTYASYYVEDGDYWKIDNVTLGYTFDIAGSGMVSDVVSGARVYVSGRNLYTFTGYQGLDPEVNTSGLTPGNDSRYKYPTTRTYTLGVSLTF